MKRLNLVLVMLLCTPLLFATNIDDLFTKWKKDYPVSTTEKWEDHKVTQQENEQMAKELGIQGVKGDEVTVFESASATIVAAVKEEMKTVSVPKGFEVLFSKTYPNGIQVYVVGQKLKDTWKEAYGVFFDKSNKVVAFRVKGELPHEVYEGLSQMGIMMLDQFAASAK
ncbi:hypothetical protein [Bacteroides propionicifaciens]|uniref:hypothetical protein n=1 Tax=Bacteroides propionicifaciens TaxID=392838 RepID=UPI00037A2DA3|nr:hypothetical protein [Bacteroides propionicifaciens]